MSSTIHLIAYLAVGFAGGYLGLRLKIPAGVIIGAIAGVVALNLFEQKQVNLPAGYIFVIQVLIGVMIGSQFRPDLIPVLGRLALPIAGCTLLLVMVGLAMAWAFARLGLMDLATAYLSTSPGAMTALVSMAAETDSNAAVVFVFHFFRIVFVLATAPSLFHLMTKWLGHQ
jgi:membrane AbrB-like protein